MQINPYKGKSEEDILAEAQKVFDDPLRSKEDRFRELMLICKYSRDPKNRKEISVMAHKNASCPEEAIPALKIQMNPEFTEPANIVQ
ncbi:MAG TPA: hypothetical protein P5096_03395 [Patescibacteria group bacterium]|nr:hypothetical protein [Patescibacteria group bacterium]